MSGSLTPMFARFLIPGGTFIGETESVKVNSTDVNDITFPEGACAVMFSHNQYFDDYTVGPRPIHYIDGQVIDKKSSLENMDQKLPLHMHINKTDTVIKVASPLKTFFQAPHDNDIVYSQDDTGRFQQTWPTPQP